MTIRTRLILSYVATTIVAMVLLAGYNLSSFERYVLASMQSDLQLRADALTEPVADALDANDLEAVQRLVQPQRALASFTVRIFDPEGRLLASTNADEDREIREWRELPGLSDALESRPSFGRGRGLGPSAAGDRLFDARPLARDGQLLGILRVSQTLGSFEQEIRKGLLISVGAVAFTFALCLLVGWRFARAIAAPVQAMRNFAVRLGGGNFGEQLEVRRKDELGELATELNHMSARLARLDDERRSFLANASHEMRTPVSNVLVTLEALESGALDEPALRDRFLRTAIDETRRLARLVQDLLNLGRLDAGVVQLEPHDLSLAAFVGRAARAIEPRMQARGIRLEVEVEDVRFHADPERLLQAVMNVLDNALKFTPESGAVSLSGGRDGDDHVVLAIHDEGPGIAPIDLPHVFEQFYTADPSRRRGGTGLGLAMARRIVDAHGGTITAASPQMAGALITLRLPLSPPRPGVKLRERIWGQARKNDESSA